MDCRPWTVDYKKDMKKLTKIIRIALLIIFMAMSSFATTRFLDLGSSDNIFDDYNWDPIAEQFNGDNYIRIFNCYPGEDHEGNHKIERCEQMWSMYDMYKENPLLATGWYPYADLADLPGDLSNWITMRMLRGFFQGQFFVRTDDFRIQDNKNRDTLYLTIRFKDINFDPGASVNTCDVLEKRAHDDGTPIYLCNHWNNLGDIGGAHDFVWKTKTIEIPPASLIVQEPELVGDLYRDGTIFREFRLSISPGIYGSSDLHGELYIDWIEITDQTPTTEADTQGFWPEIDPNPNFSDFVNTGFIHDGEPFFPIGLAVAGTHRYWDESYNYLKNAKEMGFNFVTYAPHTGYSDAGGWFWGDRDSDPQDQYWLRYWDIETHYPSRQLGFPQFLDLATSYGLMVVPWFSTDMWRDVILHVGRDISADFSYYDGTFLGIVNLVEQIVLDYKYHENILMWFIKDEADHMDEWWGSPVESVRMLYEKVTETDGEHPCWVNNMGWRHEMFKFYKDTFDVGSFDRYPHDFDAYDEIAQWAERFKQETNNEKMFIPILQSEREPWGGEFYSIENLRITTYLALIHGAQGIFYYDDPGPNKDLDIYQYCTSCGPSWWSDFGELISEVNELSYTALHNTNAVTLIDEGESDSTKIHSLFRENIETKEEYLIAINPYENEPDEEVINSTFYISWLEAGDVVHVLFEDREIVADAGSFTDHFTSGETHVYFIQEGEVCLDCDEDAGTGGDDSGSGGDGDDDKDDIEEDDSDKTETETETRESIIEDNEDENAPIIKTSGCGTIKCNKNKGEINLNIFLVLGIFIVLGFGRKKSLLL